MSWTRIHYHIACLLLLLICKLSLRQWEIWLPPSTIHSLSYLITIYMYSGIRIVNPHPCRKQPYRLEYSAYVQFLLHLVLQTMLISKLTVSIPFPLLSFSDMVSCICNTLLFLSHSAFHPGIPNLLNDFLNCIH